MSDASITGFFISLLRRHPDLRTSGWGHGLIDLAVQYDLEISESVAPPLVVDDVCFVQQPVEDGGGERLVTSQDLGAVRCVSR